MFMPQHVASNLVQCVGDRCHGGKRRETTGAFQPGAHAVRLAEGIGSKERSQRVLDQKLPSLRSSRLQVILRDIARVLQVGDSDFRLVLPLTNASDARCTSSTFLQRARPLPTRHILVITAENYVRTKAIAEEVNFHPRIHLSPCQERALPFANSGGDSPVWAHHPLLLDRNVGSL